MAFTSISVDDVLAVHDKGVNFRWMDTFAYPFAVHRIECVGKGQSTELCVHMDDTWTAGKVLDGTCVFDDIEKQARAMEWAEGIIAGCQE